MEEIIGSKGLEGDVGNDTFVISVPGKLLFRVNKASEEKNESRSFFFSLFWRPQPEK